MRMFYSLLRTLALLSFSVLCFLPLQAQELVRTISLDSGYGSQSYSNRAIDHFALEFTQLYSGVFNGVSAIPFVGDNPVGRGVWSLLGFSLATPYAAGLNMALHQNGHGTRIAAIGQKPEYFFYSDPDDLDSYDPDDTYSDFFSYFFQAINRTDETGGTQASGDTLFKLGTDDRPDDWGLVIQAGGVNHQSQYADLLEETIYLRGGHLAYLPFYLKAKMAVSNYMDAEDSGDFGDGGGDMAAVIRFYETEELDINRGNLRTGSDTALLLSTATYGLLFSYWSYVTEDNPVPPPLEAFDLRLPDVDFYINRKGLSYKVKSGYRVDDELLFPFAVEQVYRGESTTEVSLGANFRVGDFWIQSGFAGSSYHAALDLLLTEQFLISGGVQHYDVNSLYGERNIPSLKEGDTSDEIWARISLVY